MATEIHRRALIREFRGALDDLDLSAPEACPDWSTGSRLGRFNVYSRGLLTKPSSGPSVRPASFLLAGNPAVRFLREIAGASPDECEARAREICEQGAVGKEIEMEALFGRWLGFESPHEIHGKLREWAGSWRTDWRTALFHAWVALDQDGAMADTELTSLQPARAIYAVENADPDFPQYFRGTFHSFSFEDRVATALSALAQNNPEVACRMDDVELPARLRSHSIEAVARGWAMADPQAAFDWVQSLEDSEKYLAAVFSEWLKSDPESAQKAREDEGLLERRLGDGTIAGRAVRAMRDPREASSQIDLALNADPFLDVAALHRFLLEADIDWDRPMAIRDAEHGRRCRSGLLVSAPTLPSR